MRTDRGMRGREFIINYFEQIIARNLDRKCAGCGIKLRFHREQNHNFFATWGTQDETWERGRR